MDTYRILNEEIDKDKVIDLYKKKIINSPKFINDIDPELISVEEGYYIYCFMYGKVKDLDYYVVLDKKNISGKIDVELDFPSGLFLLNGLKREEYTFVDSLDSLLIFNKDDADNYQNTFIDKLNDRCIELICERHRVVLTNRCNKIDVVPIREFNEFDKEFYLEKIYKIHYINNKKNYVSIYSGVSNKFYSLDFVYTEEYEKFLKRYRNPIVYIPNGLKELYYDKSFDIYLKTIDELRYIKEKDLLKKIKDNYLNINHPNYYFYLLQGIFYFRKKQYLKYYKVNITNDYKILLLDLYLTFNYQNNSGYMLSEFSDVGLLEDNSLRNKIKLLEVSFKLGNVNAKKILFDHYHKPKYYSEYYIKRYS